MLTLERPLPSVQELMVPLEVPPGDQRAYDLLGHQPSLMRRFTLRKYHVESHLIGLEADVFLYIED
jgi:hypothetical protein